MKKIKKVVIFLTIIIVIFLIGYHFYHKKSGESFKFSFDGILDFFKNIKINKETFANILDSDLFLPGFNLSLYIIYWIILHTLFKVSLKRRMRKLKTPKYVSSDVGLGVIVTLIFAIYFFTVPIISLIILKINLSAYEKNYNKFIESEVEKVKSACYIGMPMNEIESKIQSFHYDKNYSSIHMYYSLFYRNGTDDLNVAFIFRDNLLDDIRSSSHKRWRE